MKKTLITLSAAMSAFLAFTLNAQAAYTDDCITFSSAASFTLKTYNASKNWDGTLWTSTDKTNWTEWNGALASAAQTGGMYNLYVRGNTRNTRIMGDNDGCKWVLTGGTDIACSGNIETLRGATGDDPSPTQMAAGCYSAMFRGCMALTSAPALPAMTLAERCYASMFRECTKLTSAPALSATILAKYSYYNMFSGCTALTVAPELPARTLAENCYSYMFYGCSSLAAAPELPATTLADYCYAYMFSYCTSLTAAPTLRATTLARQCYYYMFLFCTSLTNAPSLPATTLSYACYGSMFFGCTSLTDAPALLATTLAEVCYGSMFEGCTSLTSAPALPATTLAERCYWGMFSSCRSLTNAPALPATTLAGNCYRSMFYGCTSLTTAPSLPATAVADSCCDSMFWGCTSLTSAPALLATTLADSCYLNMFRSCTSLKSAPELRATTLMSYCYQNMFSGCTSLVVNVTEPGKEWKIPATSTTATNWGTDMFKGTGGTFQGQPTLNTTYYIASAEEYTDDCITFSSAASFSLRASRGKSWNGTLWISTDKTFWAEWDGTQRLAAQSGGVGAYNLYVRGNTNNTVITGNPGYYHDYAWCIAGSVGVACTGNIETLRGATDNDPSPTPMADYCYYRMFWGCVSLTSAPALPATTLAESCYSDMFYGCTSLTDAPALLATTLAKSCYYQMFRGCTSLTNAPALPAMTLAQRCYVFMFYGCTSLTDVPTLPATMLADYCYMGMFGGCTSLTGTPVLPAKTLVQFCYNSMFSGCTALTAAPMLSALTLASYCYSSMFLGCTSLTDVPALPATTLAEKCYYQMFAGCTSLEVNETAPGKEWKIPATSTTATNWGTDMFVVTGGMFWGQPELNTTYYIASATQPIEPGGEIVVPEGKAEAKAAEINGDLAVKAQYLKAPEGVETTAGYLGCFDAVATSGSTVAFVLNENGTNEVTEATTAVNAAALDTVFSEESTMTIGKPLVGFYYSFRQGGDVSVGDKADLNKLGGRDIISFELTKGSIQYFYQTLVTPQPIK